MQKLWRLMAVCSVAAVLAACGGGDDPDGDVDTGDTTTVSGSFTRCEAMQNVPLASQRTTLTFSTTGIALTQRVHAGSTSCGGLLVAVVEFPPITVTDGGTVIVNAPTNGTTTARRAIFTNAQANIEATVASGIVYDVVDGDLVIQDPNSATVLYRVAVVQPADTYRDLMINYNGRLYFGVEAVDDVTFPTRINYSIAWTPV